MLNERSGFRTEENFEERIFFRFIMNSTDVTDLFRQNRSPNSTKTPPSPPPLPPSFVRNDVGSIPKPPPLPPKFETVATKIFGLDDGFKAAAEKTMFQTLKDFHPAFFFFYGSLMDSEVLQHVLNLDELPRVETATIKNFRVKMWGIYPALVPAFGSTVSGTTWQVASIDEFVKLARYETSAYTTCEIEIVRQNGDIIENGKSFCWAGDPRSNDLEEGEFSLDRYQMYFKSALLRGSS